MEHRGRVNLLNVAIVIALGLIVSSITSVAIASRAYRERVFDQRTVEQDLVVKGYARMPVKADCGVWRIELRGEGATLEAAYAELEGATDAVRAFLAGHEFDGAGLTIGAIDTDVHYQRDAEGNTTRTAASYALSRDVTVSTTDVERISAAANEVTQLLKQGIHVRSSSPSYTIGSLDDIKIDILGLASDDARRRAEEIAARTGCVVHDVREARQGVMQITRPHSTKVAGYGIYDTSTIEKDVSVVVTVTFGIGAGE